MKVSVVIPVYNVIALLNRCLRSVLRQTWRDLEVILVDDGSTDGSGKLCDRLAANDARVSVVHQKNQGLSAARNTGLRQARGEYVVFLDSDDHWLLDDGLQTLVDNGTETADIVVFDNVHLWPSGARTVTGGYDAEALNRMADAQAVFSHLVATGQFYMSACTVMVRRELLISHDVWFPVGYISEDIYWSLHLWQCATTVRVHALNFYGYEHREGSISSTASLRVYDSYDKIFTYWKSQCDAGCTNSSAIRAYLAGMWVNRAYNYSRLSPADRPAARAVLRRHADLLAYSPSPKVRAARLLTALCGVGGAARILGWYTGLRQLLKR